MPLDPFALLVAGAFTGGCASIHACAHRADDVTLVLAPVAFGLAITVGWLLSMRNGALRLSDPVTDAWMLVAVVGS